MSALDKQPGGTHYKHNAIQPVEFIHANYIGFLEGCVIKRMVRWRNKGGIVDLQKAIHEIELLIELEEKRDKQLAEEMPDNLKTIKENDDVANKITAALVTLERLGYNWAGGIEWRPPLGKVPNYITEEYPLRPCTCPTKPAGTFADCRCPIGQDFNPRDYAPGDEVEVPQDRQNGPLTGDERLPRWRVLEGCEWPSQAPNGTIVEVQRPVDPFTITRLMRFERVGVMWDGKLVPDRPE